MRRVARLLLRPRALVGLLLVVGLGAMALGAPWIFPDDPMDMVGSPSMWPGQEEGFWLGTDLMGRDIAAGVFHGARVSLLVGLSAAGIALLLGTAVGAMAGFWGGAADSVLMRFTEVFQTMPPFLFTIAVVAVLGPSIGNVIFAIGITSWPAVARLARGEVMAVRRRDFVDAAICCGTPASGLLLRHVLPNALSPIIVTASVLMATAMLTEAGLSFLGLSDPNLVSWGSMIGGGREALRTHWYMAAIPGVALALAVLGLNLLGDVLDDVMDPRRGA
ncbi:ABC transporter permease [Pseudoroseomonas deserti]|uniref:ABC transporter permease n=1 Tax=Teichococcus deserti TaxID=1817963 RepID=A0A1V2H199_9PROT|nr:ABC transporter permease [Pseudoroseomonas deserti]ONG52615.1 ABC transporter permease [Pseudoroseomonas deserti]